MFYFARDLATGECYDLSINLQNRNRLKEQSIIFEDIYFRSDSGLNFIWNKGLMGPLLSAGINASKWLISIICGGFNVCTVYCGMGQARAGIISRVSCQRPGTRFYVRGINDCGNVANFVETEQVCFTFYICILFIFKVVIHRLQFLLG